MLPVRFFWKIKNWSGGSRELKASCNEANWTEKLFEKSHEIQFTIYQLKRFANIDLPTELKFENMLYVYHDLLIFGVSIFASSIGFHMTSSKFKTKELYIDPSEFLLS